LILVFAGPCLKYPTVPAKEEGPLEIVVEKSCSFASIPGENNAIV
jgi:hypothetical protein